MMSKKILIINNERDSEDLGWIEKLKEAISEIDSVDFKVIHHSEIMQSIIPELEPDLVIAYGRVTHHWTIEEINESYSKELELLKNIDAPTLGICAGFELMAIAHGASIGKMVEVDNEDVLESGYVDKKILKNNSLFNGLNEIFKCREMHREEVKTVPKDFDLLASSKMCKIQAIKHRDKEMYGVQFHPEWYNEKFMDGMVILKNFLKLV